MTEVGILLAVPPDVRGESVRLTRAGGVWDGMKRVVCWHVPKLPAGELMEIQAQFDVIASSSGSVTPKFPVLVRCDAQQDQFSEIELRANVKMNLTTGVRIMHRKV